MCGLSGGLAKNFLSSTELMNIRKLFILSQFRGEHSSGMFDYCVKKTFGKEKKGGKNEKFNEVLYWKNGDHPGYHYYEVFPDNVEGRWAENTCKVVACHTRHATKGDITDANAHPFSVGHIVGMHNGTITGTFKGSDEYGTDSEALYARISEEGIEKALKETFKESASMAFALVYFDVNTSKLYFIRNSMRPLHYYKGGGAFYWASSKNDLLYVFQNLNISSEVKEFETNKLYCMDMEKGNLDFDSIKDIQYFTANTTSRTYNGSFWKNQRLYAGEYQEGTKDWEEYVEVAYELKPKESNAKRDYKANYKDVSINYFHRFTNKTLNSVHTKWCSALEGFLSEYMYEVFEAWRADHTQEHWEALKKVREKPSTVVIHADFKADKELPFSMEGEKSDLEIPIGVNREKRVSKGRFLELVKDGCCNCSDTIDLEEADVVFWDDDKSPYCTICQAVAVTQPMSDTARHVQHMRDLERHYLTITNKTLN